MKKLIFLHVNVVAIYLHWANEKRPFLPIFSYGTYIFYNLPYSRFGGSHTKHTELSSRSEEIQGFLNGRSSPAAVNYQISSEISGDLLRSDSLVSSVEPLE